jgi:hypothetical protein
LSKKKGTYIDAKIYQHKVKDDPETRTVGINLANVRFKSTAKLVQAGDGAKGHHQNQGYLIRELAKLLGSTLPKSICLGEPVAIVNGETYRVEFSTPAAETDKAKKETRAFLKNEFDLNVKIV